MKWWKACTVPYCISLRSTSGDILTTLQSGTRRNNFYIMKILLTGNKGYIGSVLGEMLLGKGYDVTGYDTDYYAECEIAPAVRPKAQITKDVRDAAAEDFQGIDAVIHLAALSNDPLGELRPGLTEEINFQAT